MFKFLQDYNSLPNFLVRTTLLSYKRLHIRLHSILSEDKSPYCHNHPFYYISIILKGGYEEELLNGTDIVLKRHGIGSIIIRTPKDFHRIKEIKGETKTLFITWKSNLSWSLRKHPNLSLEMLNLPKNKGIFIRNIKGKEKFCKFDEFWYIGHENLDDAMGETRLSIHQVSNFKEII
mgnify:CR=1 FL=1